VTEKIPDPRFLLFFLLHPCTSLFAYGDGIGRHPMLVYLRRQDSAPCSLESTDAYLHPMPESELQ
jgi:hypothetical protein